MARYWFGKLYSTFPIGPGSILGSFNKNISISEYEGAPSSPVRSSTTEYYLLPIKDGVNVDDAVDVSDTVKLTVYRLKSDTVSVTDSISKTLDRGNVLSDSASVSDVVSRIADKLFTLSVDSVDVTDVVTATKLQTYFRSAADDVDVTDANTLEESRSLNMDVVSVSDTIDIFTGDGYVLWDDVDVTDFVVRISDKEFALPQDDIDTSDAIAAGLEDAEIITDTVSVTDVVTRLVEYIRPSSDSIDVTDSLIEGDSTVRSASDSILVTDVVAIDSSKVRVITDSVLATELLTVKAFTAVPITSGIIVYTQPDEIGGHIYIGSATPSKYIYDHTNDDSWSMAPLDAVLWTPTLVNATYSIDNGITTHMNYPSGASFTLTHTDLCECADVSVNYEIMSDHRFDSPTAELVYAGMKFVFDANNSVEVVRSYDNILGKHLIYAAQKYSGITTRQTMTEVSSDRGSFRIVFSDNLLAVLHDDQVLLYDTDNVSAFGILTLYSTSNGSPCNVSTKFTEFKSHTGIVVGNDLVLTRVYESSERIEGIIPDSSATGLVDVKIFNHDGPIASKSDAFAYPVVTGIPLSTAGGFNGTINSDATLR